MKMICFCKSAVLLAAICTLAVADSDIRTVQAEFDRCGTVMERFERSLRRFQDAVDAIERSVTKQGTTTNEAVSHEAAALENRLEYFRNRFERARGQADKIRDEIGNVSGPTCPSCIESGVSLYCRNGETMQNDIDAYLLKATDLQARAGIPGAADKPVAASGKQYSFKARRSTTDSLHRSIADCNDRAPATLRECAPPEKTAVPSSVQPSRQMQWRVSSGADYYHLEDLDTVTMTTEELRDYRRLTETPLSLWLRAKTSIRRLSESIENIDPEAYVSERKGRLETTARFALPKSLFRLEPSVKGEKWFRANASDDSTVSPFNKQPSDMGGAGLRVNFDNETATAAKPRFNVPVSVDWEHYCSDRPGYESFVEYRLLPSFGLLQRKVPLNLLFSGLAEFEDYYREESDTLDVVRLSGRFEGTMRSNLRSAALSAVWSGDRYTNATFPSAIDRFEGAFKGECPLAEQILARLRLRGIYEKEAHGKGSDILHRRGTEFTICPAMEFALIDKRLLAVPEFLWERRFGGRAIDRSVWYGRNAMEPGLHAGWSGRVVGASVKAAYRSERFDNEFNALPTTGDSRSVRCGADASVSPVPAISIDLFADYQYRVYAPYGSSARVSENITASASVTTRW